MNTETDRDVGSVGLPTKNRLSRAEAAPPPRAYKHSEGWAWFGFVSPGSVSARCPPLQVSSSPVESCRGSERGISQSFIAISKALLIVYELLDVEFRSVSGASSWY